MKKLFLFISCFFAQILTPMDSKSPLSPEDITDFAAIFKTLAKGKSLTNEEQILFNTLQKKLRHQLQKQKKRIQTDDAIKNQSNKKN